MRDRDKEGGEIFQTLVIPIDACTGTESSTLL